MKARYTVVNGEVIAEKRGGVRKTYVPDPLGSTIALLDNTQSKTDTFSYWPYGEVKTHTGTTPTPFRFVGTLGYYHYSSKRNYVRARHLRPINGKWQTPLNVSPTVLVEMNRYTYAHNSPSRFIDKGGQDAATIAIRIAAGAAGVALSPEAALLLVGAALIAGAVAIANALPCPPPDPCPDGWRKYFTAIYHKFCDFSDGNVSRKCMRTDSCYALCFKSMLNYNCYAFRKKVFDACKKTGMVDEPHQSEIDNAAGGWWRCEDFIRRSGCDCGEYSLTRIAQNLIDSVRRG